MRQTPKVLQKLTALMPQKPAEEAGFSLSVPMLRQILQQAKPLGHHEEVKSLNLGFGFLYYSLMRVLRPQHVLVIGSGYGFSVVCLALGLKDNGQGRLSFVDPSYSLLKDGPFKTIGGRSQWDDAAKVREFFAGFGLGDIVTHYKLRSDEFFAQYEQLQLPVLDVAFIDGSHAYKDVRHDFLESARRAHKNSYILLHDTNIYIREILHHAGVKRWLKKLKNFPEYFEILDFPFASGVAIVRLLQAKGWQCLASPQPDRP